MKKVLSLLVLAVLAAGLTGCGTTSSDANLGPPMVRLSVSSGAVYSLLKYPEAVPAVRASAAIICSQAAGTNLAPAEVVAAIDAHAEKTPESVLIVNAALSVYTLVWNSYGASAVAHTPILRVYLEATCSGLIDALTVVPASDGLLSATAQNPAWPQVKFK